MVQTLETGLAVEQVAQVVSDDERDVRPSPEDDDAEMQGECPVVEIMGLELLMLTDGLEASCTEFDSYAQDSFAKVHDRRATLQRRPNRMARRMSNCSSIGQDESYYGYNDYGFGHRRSSLGGGSSHHANNKDADYSKYKSTRRSSLGSYACDSLAVGARSGYKPSRRGSLDSYACDSLVGSRGGRGGYNKVSRRGSLDSYACDSLVGRGYKTGRRSSMGSRFSSLGDYANDSMDLIRQSSYRKSNDTTKRRMSNGSILSFPAGIYESQSINTGGAGRAA